MIPADSIKKIRSVTIYHWPNNCIKGFSFFDKDKKLLWEHGYTTDWLMKETVLLAEDERIVGVVAKLFSDRLSAYSNF